MLKRLRFRIVLTIMIIAVVVLACCFSVIIGITYSSTYTPLKSELDNALERGPEVNVSFIIGRQRGPADDATDNGSSIPVALAIVNDRDQVIVSNDEYRAMDNDVRRDVLSQALASSHDNGILTDHAVMFSRGLTNDGSVILAFADASSFIVTVQRTVITSIIVFMVALIVLFFLSFFITRLITRPIQQAWQSQAEFVADASHELKTPLTVILANTDILLRNPEDLDAEQLKWVEGIESESHRMKNLIESMLFLARSDEHPEGALPEAPECDLSEIVNEACLTFDAVAFEAQVELVESIKSDVMIRADRAQIEQLVKSLLDNAVKYAGSDGRVTVNLDSKKRGHAVLMITNTGDPIPPDDLDHVFDRFWRSDQARSSSTGQSYGLGLSIAKSIAESQGGTISVASNAESGTTFTVTF